MSDVISLLQELIAIPSANPGGCAVDETHGESRMAAFVADWLQARGIDFEMQTVWPGRPNVIARLEGRGEPSLVFEAHTDTVGVAGMEIEPFTPELRDGRVYGRGACDCKGSLAGMLTALEAVLKRGTPPGDILLAATVDEEYRFSGVKHLLEEGFTAGAAVVGEPTGLKLIIAHKGVLRASIVTRGKAAHSSEPEKGESAIYHMGRVLASLEEYGRELATRTQHALVGGPRVSVGQIWGGTAPNIVPDRCEIAVDRRVIPLEHVDDVAAEMRRWLGDKLPDVPWDMDVVLADGGLDGAPDSEIALLCAAALERVLGCHEVGGVQYGTDGSKFAAYGIPAVVLGPGSIDQAHTAREWVDVEQVRLGARIYEEIMWGK